MSGGLRARKGWRPMRGLRRACTRAAARAGRTVAAGWQPLPQGAFVEAANAICLHRGRAAHRHVSRLYEHLARRKGHAKAIGAVARHLAEATYWMLSKQEAYREPKSVGRVVHGG